MLPKSASLLTRSVDWDRQVFTADLCLFSGSSLLNSILLFSANQVLKCLIGRWEYVAKYPFLVSVWRWWTSYLIHEEYMCVLKHISIKALTNPYTQHTHSSSAGSQLNSLSFKPEVLLELKLNGKLPLILLIVIFDWL